jgi:hypothetical protein
MSRINSRLDRIERMLEPGDCLYCCSATTALVGAGEPAPPPCPVCGRTPAAIQVHEEVLAPPEE